MSDYVTMTHPDIEAPSGLTTRQAFEEVHRHKGWVLVEESTAPTGDASPEASEDEAEVAPPAKGARKRS